MENESNSASEGPQFRYGPKLAAEIEARWQDAWEANGTYYAANPVGELEAEVPDQVRDDLLSKKLYVLDMFPYPSGKGLHVGHPLGFIGTDVYARFHRMLGYNVLHTLGYDSFGLPAEQHAIATGVHPRKNTEDNISNMRRQLRRLGLGHDSRRSVSTTDEDFYQWTQWIFNQIFNAWYDEDQDKARPIAELTAELESGSRQLADGRNYSDLSDSEKRAAVDTYRLAYLADSPVNWCPGLGTILANEEVTAEGRSDIGNFPVFKRNMRQWMMRITSYADRLLADLERLDWPEAIKLMQQNWIGRSEGSNIKFETSAGDLEVFTTRGDTIFGVTFMVISPEHPMISELTTDEHRSSVANYVAAAAAKTDQDRTDDTREKTGVFTGSMATNPTTGEQVPIWVADYVLMGYGTGAVMAVPCGDQRDFEFARKYGLDIKAIQQPPADWFESHGIDSTMDTSLWPVAYAGNAPYVDSKNDKIDLEAFDSIADANAALNAQLEAEGRGSAAVTYRLRDWLFSRQRYWGEPFPILYDVDGNPHSVPDDMLPWLLPELEDFAPTAMDAEDDVTDPVPPLARAEGWTEVELDIGDGLQTYRRDINVMPQWAGSCWYELRYLDPTNSERFVDPEIERYWMGPEHEGHTGGTDLYIGGVEHAVLHLLYARFWHKVLFDLGHVSSVEPFHRLFNQGYIQAYAYRDERGQTVPADDVIEQEDGSFMFEGEPVTQEYGKMGKSLKNIVTPDDMYDAYGADTFRLYEMSMGPLDSSRPWNSRDVIGMQRFLQRFWRLIVNEETGEAETSDEAPTAQIDSQLHTSIQSLREDMAGLKFNTSIARLIELTNSATQTYTNNEKPLPKAVAVSMVQMIAPLAPHFAEELWSKLGQENSVHHSSFPEVDESKISAETVTMIVQLNGKVKERLEVDPEISEADAEQLALACEAISSRIDGEPKKVIVRAPKLVNVVA